MNQQIRTLAKKTRFYRRLHKFVAIPLCLFMFILGVTGLLLTWKSELSLTPETQISSKNQVLLSLSELELKALFYIDSLKLENTINRIDYRPSKGIAKIRFENHLTELQIDSYSGQLLSIKKRNADLIEMIHDGSIIDFLFKSKSENVKLFYSSITSLGLILLAISGFLLWLKPKQLKRYKRVKH